MRRFADESVAKSSQRVRRAWRYRELLPIDGVPTVGEMVGFTPLIRSDRLAKALGVSELYIKNDTVNYPTLSFKDRVVSVALSRAREPRPSVVALRFHRQPRECCRRQCGCRRLAKLRSDSSGS